MSADSDERSAVRRVGGALRLRWGFYYFTLVSFLTLFKLFDPSTRGHYRVFTSAARALWNEQPAYFTDFSWQTGLHWFYSPACGLFFYLPFSLLPETVGVILNVFVMWVVFVWGATYFFNAVLESPTFEFVTVSSLNLFWFFTASEMIGAIASEKTEILMIGTCFLSAGLLLRGRNHLPAFLLAMVTNWKFQPVAFVGLVAIALFLHRKNIRFAVEFSLWSLFFLVLPYLFVGPSYLNAAYLDWMHAVQQQLASQWKSFDHVYNVVRTIVGIDISYQAVQMTALIVGICFAALQVAEGVRKSPFIRSIFLAIGLSAAFMTSFSPLSQSNGYILVAPLTAVLALCYGLLTSRSLEKYIAASALVIGWILTSVLTSDLVPVAVRDFTRATAVKSLGPLLMAATVIWLIVWRRPKQIYSRITSQITS